MRQLHLEPCGHRKALVKCAAALRAVRRAPRLSGRVKKGPLGIRARILGALRSFVYILPQIVVETPLQLLEPARAPRFERRMLSS